MSSAISRFLNKPVPLWQVVTLFAVVGAGVHLVHGGCCQRTATTAAEDNTKPEDSTPPAATPAAAEAAEKTEEVVAEQEKATEAAEGAEDREEEVSEDEWSDEDDDEDWSPFKTDWLFFDGPYPIVDSYSKEDGPAKMVLCVNMELKMGKGKIAAQCGHATLGAYKLSRKYCKSGLLSWEMTGTTKVAVKVEKEEEFMSLLEKAKIAGVVCTIVEDAGRTQIAAGSRTVLALGPAPAAVLDQISGHLKLL